MRRGPEWREQRSRLVVIKRSRDRAMRGSPRCIIKCGAALATDRDLYIITVS